MNVVDLEEFVIFMDCERKYLYQSNLGRRSTNLLKHMVLKKTVNKLTTDYLLNELQEFKKYVTVLSRNITISKLKDRIDNIEKMKEEMTSALLNLMNSIILNNTYTVTGGPLEVNYNFSNTELRTGFDLIIEHNKHSTTSVIILDTDKNRRLYQPGKHLLKCAIIYQHFINQNTNINIKTYNPFTNELEPYRTSNQHINLIKSINTIIQKMENTRGTYYVNRHCSWCVYLTECFQDLGKL